MHGKPYTISEGLVAVFIIHTTSFLLIHLAQRVAGDTLQHQVKLVGHEQTVTSVCFKPGTDNTLMSTADDRVIKLWDVRQKAATCTVRALFSMYFPKLYPTKIICSLP